MSVPGQNLFSDMRAHAGADAPGLDFEDLDGLSAVHHEANVRTVSV